MNANGGGHSTSVIDGVDFAQFDAKHVVHISLTEGMISVRVY